MPFLPPTLHFDNGDLDTGRIKSVVKKVPGKYKTFFFTGGTEPVY